MPQSHLGLVTYGPYELPHDSSGRGTSKRIERSHAEEFWAQPELDKIRGKQGCYVFALGVSGGFTPWYVGKTTKSFQQESMRDHKLVYYNEVVFKGNKGTPVMFFVARPGSLTKIPRAQIDNLETFLIQTAVFKNPGLKNKKKAVLPRWGIRGVVRGGKGKSSARAKVFKSMIGL
jgi:hypothetical protein